MEFFTRRKSFSRKETVVMDEVRFFGYCENCGEKVVDNNEAYYVSYDGKVFCSVECCLEYYGVTKIEV
jgi:hypothetical protein